MGERVEGGRWREEGGERRGRGSTCQYIAGRGPPHLSGLGPAVAQPGDKVLTVVGVEAVEQLLPHHPQGLLHNEAAGPRPVNVVQHVVHLEGLQLHHFLHLLPPHPHLVVLHQQHQVPPAAQPLPWRIGRWVRWSGEEAE